MSCDTTGGVRVAHANPSEDQVPAPTDTRSDARVATTADIRAHLDTLDLGVALCELTHGEIYAEAYAAGRADEAAAWRNADDEVREARHRRHAAFLARLEPLVELCERRGEHERAERQRQLLRERGVIA